MVVVVDRRDLDLLESIGSGTFAEVYKATWSRADGEEAMIVAVKESKNNKIARENIEREIEVMSLVSHENIVSIFGTSESPQHRTRILMEYADCGSLYSYLHSGGEQERAYSYLDCLRWMHQCAKGVAYIHNMNPKVIHRDLKTQNLVLFQDYQILKICDFGTATHVDATDLVGTVYYMAPEVMHCNTENKYTEKCDVYSFAIILWEVLARRKPMSHLKNNVESVILSMVGFGERPPLHYVDRYANCNDIKVFIKACWNADPTKRPTMTIVETYLFEKLRSPATIFPNLTDLYALSPGICFAKYAPPESQWYHGQLDRCRAEARLRKLGQVGSYLVRRSEYQHSNYVLSFFTGKSCLHFDIEVMYGKLYFAGDKFDSLIDLIGYFTKFCNIHEADHLRLPVAPPEMVNDTHRVVAILANTQGRIRRYTYLIFSRGDIFTVHNDMGGGILWVTDFRSGKQGLIYRGFVDDLDGSIDPNMVHPWFHEVVPAYPKFLEAGPNSFVVEPSKEQPGDYLVHILIDHKIREVLVRFRDAAYAIGESDRRFASLSHLIDYYRHAHILEGHSLGEPVQRYRQPHLKGPLFPEVAVRRIHQSSQKCFDVFFSKLLCNTKSLGELDMRAKECDNWTKYNVFVICEGGRDLLCFGEQYSMFQELPPKGRIDLSRASLYECHNSLWNRPNCWLLVESLQGKRKETYFCAGSRESYDMCIALLRPLCTFQLCNAQMDVPQSRHGAYLSVQVMNSLLIPGARPSQRIYLNFAFDQAVVARSEAQMLCVVMWNIVFKFDNIPPDVRTLQIQVMRDNVHEEMSYLEIKLNTLDKDREEDYFYHLKSRFKKYCPNYSGKDRVPSLQKNETQSEEYMSGKLQLRTYYLNDFILPVTAYAPLRELMIEFDILVFRLLSSASEMHDHSWLAKLLLRICTREHCDSSLVGKLGKLQISLAEETQTLYNEGTLENTMIKLFMRRECSDYVKALLTDTVQRIIASVGAADGAEDFMLHSLDWIAKDIFKNESEINCPINVAVICRNIQSIAMSKWPMNRAKFTTCISEFIFRFVFCSALEDPQGFGLIDKRPTTQASSHLNRLSECFWQLATLQEFDSDQHPDMVGFNPFIHEHKQSMIDLMDRFVSDSEGNTLPEIEIERLSIITEDCVRDLNDIHYFCELRSVKLAKLKDCQWKEKLMNVIKGLSEMKSQHRSRHINERERLPWPLQL